MSKIMYMDEEYASFPDAQKRVIGYGTGVELENNYTSKSGAYTAPSDGIIRLQSRYTSGNYISATICNSDGTNEISFQVGSAGTANQNISFPIWKGMKVWRSANNGQYNYIHFYPYKYEGA